MPLLDDFFISKESDGFVQTFVSFRVNKIADFELRIIY